jgi:ABC-2 type transport system permease protein
VHRLTIRYRYSIILLKQLVKTDFKLRYQGSVLGYVWSLLRPLFMFAILYIIFGVVLKAKANIPYYPVYLLLGILLWNFFAEITTGSVAAIVGKGDLLRKINFPKYVIILANALSATINLALGFVILGLLMAYRHVPLTWHALLIIPLVFEILVLALALAFFLSALFVKYRDVTYIWEVFMQAAFYATPILYPLGKPYVPARAAKYLLLNPMAQAIQDSRHVLVSPVAPIISTFWGGDKWIWLIPLGLVVIALIVGAGYFRSRSRYFAEEV